ncbi:MAG: CHAT domain-containing tetratricopeptide repeat protein [Bacteroidia bacterium]|nr:CHAT domain-containing protein [Bacteroidia bacterium]MDW8134187.1 CHAT domain-containing tetratricopeptide repeat protein [Bacteroidia bacterium]
MRLLVFLCIASLLFGQTLPNETLYFQGKLSSFFKKAQRSYQRQVKRKGMQDENAVAIGLAYALALTDFQHANIADSILRHFAPLMEGNVPLSDEIRYRQFWIEGRIRRGIGLIAESDQAFNKAFSHAQAPWQKALIKIELTENLLLLGNTAQAEEVLRETPSFEGESYAPYLSQRKTFLQTWLSWQKGLWDSLPTTKKPLFSGDHGAYYQAQYFYLQALAAAFRGEKKSLIQYLKKSQQWGRKTAYGGKDIQTRAEAMLFLHELYGSRPVTHERRVSHLNPILSSLRDPEMPFTYTTTEALTHVTDICLLLRRTTLIENLLSLYVARGEGILAGRIHRLASRVARAEYKASIAWGYATRAFRKTEKLPFLTLEHAYNSLELGEAALISSKSAQADSAFSLVRQILKALGEPEGPLTFSIREVLASRSLQFGQYKRAESELYHQRRTYERLLPSPSQNPGYLRNLLLTADLGLRMGQLSQVDSFLRLADDPIQNLPPAYIKERVSFHELRGDLAQAKGNFREAEREYMEAVRLRAYSKKESQKTIGEESGSLLRLALLYQRTGRLTRAKDIYQRITSIYQNSGREDAEVASYYIGLAEFYLLYGDYLKAEESAKKARELNFKLQGATSPSYVQALLISARVEGSLGRYDKQESFLRSALSAQQKFYEGRPSLSLSRTIYLLAENTLLRGKRDSAAYLLTKSADEAERAKMSAPLEYASVMLDIGGVWLAVDSFVNAQTSIEAAKTILETEVPPRHPDRLRALLYEARLRQREGNYTAALKIFHRWLSIWRAVYGPKHPEYPFYLAELADIHWLAGDNSAAKKNYEKSVSLLLNQVDKLFNGLTESEKARYWARVRQVLEHYYAFAFSEGNPAARKKAYEVYLSTKAFILSETAQLRARLAKTSDTTIRRIFQTWQDQKEYLTRLYSYSPTELKELGINLAEEENYLNELEKQLTAYIGDIRMRRPTWKQLQNALPQDAAAIDWIRLRVPLSRDSLVYYAVITTPSLKQPLYVCLPEGKKLESYYFFRYSQSIMNFEKDTTSYAAFWGHVIEKLPPTVSRLFVCSDGVYYQINPSTIPLPQGGYLVDKFQVIHFSRLASLTKSPKPLKFYEGRKAYIIADPDYAAGVPEDSIYIPPLPGTAEEARVLRDIFQSEGILPYIYIRNQATETLLHEVISPYILHIATHGIFLPYDESLGNLIGVQSTSALSNPLFRSALLLAQSGRSMLYGTSDVGKDGILNAYELLSMELTNTQLVALSACETGLGEVQNGEGVYGLQRAFLLAGARNLLLSLWKVDDEATREFMISFYSEWLRKKLSIEEAFWNAQRAMRSGRKAPYFWGAFILVKP